MATNQDKKINEYKKNPTVAESAYVVGLNSNDENINIPRATLAEIVRQELYRILNASAADQGTTVTKVPVLGGDRIGSSSIADLASVLGARIELILTQNADPDSITVPGMYQSTSWDTTKAPSSSGVLWMPMFRNGFWRFELFIGTGVGDLWYRRGTSTVWTAFSKFNFV